MNQECDTAFELPRKLELVLATLATYYGQQGKPALQRLVVNSRYRVQEEWTYDNWDGGTYGHAVYFQVPKAIFFELFDDLGTVAEELTKGINRVSNVKNEYIDEVFVELAEDDPALVDWREKSGVLLGPGPSPDATSDLTHLWTPGHVRLFVTHKADYKREASKLKDALDRWGVTCFVAHEDIKPTKEWQREIEKALFSMDVLAALMTDEFSNSEWTDQEIGVAIGRGVPIIPVKIGIDPYGFIGKYQALSAAGKKTSEVAQEIYDLLWGKASLKERLTDSLITRFERADSYDEANTLVRCLERIESASPEIIKRLENAPKDNSQVSRAFSVKDRLPRLIARLRGHVT